MGETCVGVGCEVDMVRGMVHGGGRKAEFRGREVVGVSAHMNNIRTEGSMAPNGKLLP